jgi:hypothetical protein
VIVLNLICGSGHRFEAWFASAEAFDGQRAAGQVACPHCQATEVSRLPNAPHVRRASPQEPQLPSAPDAAALRAQTLARMADAAEDVGARFPEEARRIHYRETAERSIRGRASVADALELLDEGIPVLPLPSPGKKSSH